jgi:heme-degrading monooxygenase HmoA
MQILTLQELRLKPAGVEDFVARFRELDVLPKAAAAADGELLDAVMGQSDKAVVVVTRWASVDGIAAWLASPARARVQSALEPYYAEPPVVRRFTLRARFEAAREPRAADD